MMFHFCHALRMAEDLYCTSSAKMPQPHSMLCLDSESGELGEALPPPALCPNLFEQLVEKGELYLCILFLIKSEKENTSCYFLHSHEVRTASSLSLSPEQLKTIELLYLRFLCILTYWCNSKC